MRISRARPELFAPTGRGLVQQALTKARGAEIAAARYLNIPISTLHHLMRLHGLVTKTPS